MNAFHPIFLRFGLIALALLLGWNTAQADPLNISIEPPTVQPVYLGVTASLPITIEPTFSGATVTGLSASLSGGLGPFPLSWNFDLVSHDCPGTMTAMTVPGGLTPPVRLVSWTGIGAVSGSSPIQCSIEIRPRNDFATASPITLRVECDGCSGDDSDRDTALVSTGQAADVEVKLQFNESEEVGTIAGQLIYSNVGLAEARNLNISMFGDPALFVDLEELDNRPGCNQNAQLGFDSRTWTMTSLMPGESVQCRFNTTLSATGSYNLNALISAETLEGLPDPWPENNTDSVTIVATELVINTRFSLSDDTNPGDGVCADANGNCSLRAAVDETNALPGVQTIVVPYEFGGYYLGGLSDYLTITDPVVLAGLPDSATGALPWISRSDSDDAGLIRVSVIGSTIPTEIRNLDLRGNSDLEISQNGAVVRHTRGPLLISDSKISGGWTTGGGGGLSGGPGLEMNNVEIFNNRAGFGGGLRLTGLYESNAVEMSLFDVAIHNNVADSNGGGVSMFHANAAFDRVSVYANQAVRGGGFYIAQWSDTLITNSTISQNVADLQGGGLFQVDDARRTSLDFVTLAYNQAGPGDNSVGDGGGIYTEDSDVAIGNSILAFNTARTSNGGQFGTVVSGNCSGVLDSSGYSTIAWIDGDPDCSVFTSRPTDSYNLTPGLGSLVSLDNGISYHPLTRVNNEIDQAGVACVSAPEPYNFKDNAGRSRPLDGDGEGEALCDRGAYEASPYVLSLTTSSVAPSGWRIDLDNDLLSCSDAQCTYGNIPPGIFLTLTPVAQPGTEFTGWGGDCVSAGTSDCTLDMTESRSVSANFQPNRQTFALTTQITGSGSLLSLPSGIDCPGTCEFDFAHGTEVTLLPVAEPGSAFFQWTGGCAGSTDCVVTMSQARTVRATFIEIEDAIFSSRFESGL